MQPTAAAATFGDGVQIGLLAHGRQERQGADVDAHLGVSTLLPGVVLHHVEEATHQVEHGLLWVVLEHQQRSHICNVALTTLVTSHTHLMVLV